jgi:hypothetical protein
MARRVAAEVTLLQVVPVPSTYDPEELGFELEGHVGEEPFKAQISIEPDMKLWAIQEGDLPEGSEDDVIRELYQDPRYKSHEMQSKNWRPGLSSLKKYHR